MKDIREQRAKGLLFYFVTGNAHGSVRASMVGFSAGDDLRTPSETFCQLKSALICFRSGVDKVAAVEGCG